MHKLAFALAVPAAVLFSAAQALACGPRVEINFYEDGGGDVFEIVNKSQENWAVKSLVLSLSGSSGRLIFDTDGGGLGASMYQPFSAGASDVGFEGASPVTDGGEVVALRFSAFTPGKTFTFYVDVDDRLVESRYGQAMVTDEEIQGATGEAEMVHPSGESLRASGAFGREGKAIIGGGGLCT
jgi:hypothetical protein